MSGVIDVNLREFLWDIAGHSGTRSQNCQAGTKSGESVSMFYKYILHGTVGTVGVGLWQRRKPVEPSKAFHAVAFHRAALRQPCSRRPKL